MSRTTTLLLTLALGGLGLSACGKTEGSSSTEPEEAGGAGGDVSTTLTQACATLKAELPFGCSRPQGSGGDPDLSAEKAFRMYCDDRNEVIGQGHFADCWGAPTPTPDCKASIAPYLECIASTHTCTPELDCTHVMPKAACDPAIRAIAAEPIAACKAVDYAAGSDEPTVFEWGLCPDGHVYGMTCDFSDACALSCNCRIDGQTIRTVTVSEFNRKDFLYDWTQACDFAPGASANHDSRNEGGSAGQGP